jgi:hypothetical protein
MMIVAMRTSRFAATGNVEKLLIAKATDFGLGILKPFFESHFRLRFPVVFVNSRHDI